MAGAGFPRRAVPGTADGVIVKRHVANRPERPYYSATARSVYFYTLEKSNNARVYDSKTIKPSLMYQGVKQGGTDQNEEEQKDSKRPRGKNAVRRLGQ